VPWPIDFTVDSPATIKNNNRHYYQIKLTTNYTSTQANKSIKLFYLTYLYHIMYTLSVTEESGRGSENEVTEEAHPNRNKHKEARGFRAQVTREDSYSAGSLRMN
jgi:hypothetical protein